MLTHPELLPVQTQCSCPLCSAHGKSGCICLSTKTALTNQAHSTLRVSQQWQSPADRVCHLFVSASSGNSASSDNRLCHGLRARSATAGGGGGGWRWWREEDPYWPMRDWGDHPMRWWTWGLAGLLAGEV
jgi:hypothetical protein